MADDRGKGGEEALREQLAARESENLALVQALRSLQAQCAHFEGSCAALAARVRPSDAANETQTTATVDGSVELSAPTGPQSTAIQGRQTDSEPLESCNEQVTGSGGSEVDTLATPQSTGPALIENKAKIAGEAYWRARVARLEELLGASEAENGAFEDTVDRLEAQIREMARQWEADESRRRIDPHAREKILLVERCDKTEHALHELQAKTDKLKVDNARLRASMQRKSDLLVHEKAKSDRLQDQLTTTARGAEELKAINDQCVELRCKVKEQARQLQELRAAGVAFHDDNVQMAFHLEKAKKELQEVTARCKSVQSDNQRLRNQITELKATAVLSSSTNGVSRPTSGSSTLGASIGPGEEEAKALRRRVLQKQELLVGLKAKVASLEEELDRQGAAMLKLAQTNRQLLQNLKTEKESSTNALARVQTKLEEQVANKQQQLDGLRASVLDSFDAFVSCSQLPATGDSTHAGSLTAHLSSSNQEDSGAGGDQGDIDKACAWTEFSPDDLASLRVSGKRAASAVERIEVRAALNALDVALDQWPEDCRAELCHLLESLH